MAKKKLRNPDLDHAMDKKTSLKNKNLTFFLLRIPTSVDYLTWIAGGRGRSSRVPARQVGRVQQRPTNTTSSSC